MFCFSFLFFFFFSLSLQRNWQGTRVETLFAYFCIVPLLPVTEGSWGTEENQLPMKKGLNELMEILSGTIHSNDILYILNIWCLFAPKVKSLQLQIKYTYAYFPLLITSLKKMKSYLLSKLQKDKDRCRVLLSVERSAGFSRLCENLWDVFNCNSALYK